MNGPTEENKIKAIELLAEMNVKEYEITDIHYGNSLAYGKLTTIIVKNRHIYDPREFNKIGSGIVCRNE
jgi:hypothetical protein